jgi:predicted nucleic acid-binding protein
MNVERAARRRKAKATDAGTIQAFIEDLERLPVDIDISSSAVVFDSVQALCRKHGLTACDAAYLEIAIREKNELATVDHDLRRAAAAEGVELL